MKPPNLFPLLAASLLVMAPAIARAQDSVTAEALFNKGVADLKAGNFDAACPAIAESQRLDPRPGTQFTLAECLGRAGKLASAVVAYEDYLRTVRALPQAQQGRYLERNRVAEAQKVELGPQIPHLAVVLPKDALPGTRVTRDGTDLTSPMMGLALPLDPGEHVVVMTMPGRLPVEERITLQKGESKTLELALPVEKKPEAYALPTDPPDSGHGSGSMRAIAMYGAGGLGIAGIIAGGVTGGIALGKKSTANEHCKDFLCDAEGLDAVESGRTMGLVSTVGFVVGAAGVATAAVLWFTQPKEKKAAASTAVRADLIEVGERGAVMGVKGVF